MTSAGAAPCQNRRMTASPLPSYASPAGDGIFVIDTGFQRPAFDAAYLLVHEGRAAFIDTGTNHAVPRLLETLAATGLSTADVDYVIPTHVHLDHAGGAGKLMAALPRAELIVHPRGARHMINPSALYQGALAVYGAAEMERSYGKLVGVDASRVRETHDGMVVALGSRRLDLIDTPGHARHHNCIWDAQSRGWFTGDTFGLSYRELDSANGPFILPTSSPVQFEPEALQASIARMLAQAPQAMYLTHFGRVEDVPRLAAELHEQVDAMVSLAQACDGGPDRHRELVAALSGYYLERAQAHGCALDDAAVLQLLEMDIELNAQGLEIWLDRGRRV